MADRGSLRASDADREQIAERLRQATAEGRLEADELEQRIGAVFAAKTYGELDSVTSDLPGPTLPSRAQRRHLSRRRPPHPVVIIAAIPLVMIAVAVITGIVAMWMIWALASWFFFGRRRRHYGWGCAQRHPRTHSLARPARGYWI